MVWTQQKQKILRSGKNTQKNCTKKDLHNPDNYDGVITHLEPDNMECEVKQALGSITTKKASGGDGILVQLFQILKDDAVQGLHSICQKIWKTQQWPQDWKRSVFIPVPKKGNDKECSSYCTIAFISHASKVMLKILQARLQQYVSQELPRCSSWFQKRQRNQTSNCQYSLDHQRSKRVPEKHLLLLLLLSHVNRVRLCATPQTAAQQAPLFLDSPGKNTGVGCHFLLQCMKVKIESEVAQSCLTLSNPMDCMQPTRLLRLY